MRIEETAKPNKLHPLLSIVLLLGLFLIFLMVGQTIAWFLLSSIYHYPLDALNDFTLHPENYGHSRMAMLLNHAVGTILFSFVLSTYVWKKIVERDSFNDFFASNSNHPLTLFVIAIAVTVLSTPLNSVFISLNKNMQLPDFMEKIELKVKAMELQVEQTIKFLTDFQNPIEICMAVLVMGALTGIGEELFFRGALQKRLHQWLKNPHIAIWVAATIFSFLHFQFYGFLPRMLLAALFGYLYYWSGNLWIPIVAHASNNSFTVLALHFSKDMEETKKLVESEEVMPLAAVLVSAVLTILLLYFFKKHTEQSPKEVSVF